jgi:AraC family transcriptional regulator, regulatory protein of adaptative response / methylated-DNA-[protein]-cysteine methyltransferase
MNDFNRVARIIDYLDENGVEQPSLEALGDFAGLSASRLHHLFVEWAGVTPKDFLQCLTLNRARTLLRDGVSVLDSALESGLSGPGRLHDLCVSLEAATPGEVKSGGEGMLIRFDYAVSPFGECIVAESPRGICHLAFLENGERDLAEAELRANWPNADLQPQDFAKPIVGRLFGAGSNPDQALRVWVKGTRFQVSVWRALLRIPPGSVASYRQLAVAVGAPRSARAVGNAVGANPLACLIPCHRVIRETGVIGNYRWRPGRKRALLAWETAMNGDWEDATSLRAS